MKKISSIINPTHNWYLRNRFIVHLCVVVILAKLVFTLLFVDYEGFVTSDMSGYFQRAVGVANGEFVEFSTYYTPFYHVFLGGVFFFVKLIGLSARYLDFAILSSFLLSIVFIYSFHKLTVFFVGERLLSKVLTIIIAFWFPFWYLNFMVMSENLFVPLLFIGLYLIVARNKSYFSLILAGLIFGLAAITRSIFIIFVPIIVLWLAYLNINVKKVGAMFVAFVSVLVLMVGINFLATEGTIIGLSSNGGPVFALAWCGYERIEYKIEGSDYYSFHPPAYYVDGVEMPDYISGVPFSNQPYYYSLGIECIKKNPGVIYTNLMQVYRLFDSIFFPRFYQIWGSEQLLSIFRVLGNVLALLSIVTAFVYRLKPWQVLFLSLFVANMLGVYLQAVGEERYLLPMVPLLVLFNYQWFEKLGILLKKGLRRLAVYIP